MSSFPVQHEMEESWFLHLTSMSRNQLLPLLCNTLTCITHVDSFLPLHHFRSTDFKTVSSLLSSLFVASSLVSTSELRWFVNLFFFLLSPTPSLLNVLGFYVPLHSLVTRRFAPSCPELRVHICAIRCFASSQPESPPCISDQHYRISDESSVRVLRKTKRPKLEKAKLPRNLEKTQIFSLHMKNAGCVECRSISALQSLCQENTCLELIHVAFSLRPHDLSCAAFTAAKHDLLSCFHNCKNLLCILSRFSRWLLAYSSSPCCFQAHIEYTFLVFSFTRAWFFRLRPDSNRFSKDVSRFACSYRQPVPFPHQTWNTHIHGSC